MDQHNITPSEKSLQLNQFKDNKINEFNSAFDSKIKTKQYPFQVKFLWYCDPSDQNVLPVEDKKLETTITSKELPISFQGRGEVKGRHFAQIKRSCSAYLYEVRISGAIYYEVFIRKQNRLYGNITYPSANAFGGSAWTSSSYKRASEIFDKLSQKGGD